MTPTERFAALVAAEILMFNLLAAAGATVLEGMIALAAMAWAWPIKVGK